MEFHAILTESPDIVLLDSGVQQQKQFIVKPNGPAEFVWIYGGQNLCVF